MYWVISYWHYIEVKEYYNILTVPFEKSKIVSIASSINIAMSPGGPKFAVNLIFRIGFGSASSACYLLKLIAIIL